MGLRPSATTAKEDARRRGDGYGPALSPVNNGERPERNTSRHGPRPAGAGPQARIPKRQIVCRSTKRIEPQSKQLIPVAMITDFRAEILSLT